MIASYSDYKKYINLDSTFYKKPSFIDVLLKNEGYYLWNFVCLLRKVEYHKNTGHKLRYLWYFFRYKRLSSKLHITVYPNTVEPGLKFFHVGSYTHISKTCKIGKNVTILPGVVFGNKSQKLKNQPIEVGDNCYFGLDAKIFGPVKIGNNVIVGANSVVTKDIPDNAVVAGVPAKIIKINE